MKQDRILITGASSGIGEALACALARPGATLFLTARDEPRLHAVAGRCRSFGASVVVRTADVTDRPAMESLIADCGSLDLVFASAGIAHGISPDGSESADQIRATLAVNVDGVLNTVLPAMALMLEQPTAADGVRGRIVVIASVAALIPYPNTPSYCASKAAVDTWTVATAANSARHGIFLTSVCPGFVSTPMTARNDFPMPGLLSADEAVGLILEGVRAGRRRVVFPVGIGAGARFVGLLPARLREEILKRQPSKAPAPMTHS
jgi:short-subunit dehydrogenase